MSREVPSYFLRAEGNLNYYDFVRAIEAVWREVNPAPIPFYSYGTAIEGLTFPCIIFNLEGRQVFEEPKPKVREVITNADGEIMVIKGWRFQDTVSFIICTDGNPEMADLLAEAFEDFMLEYTGVFKRLGISEIRYGRRYKARLETSWGEDMVTRWIDYFVITEKVYVQDQEKLEEIALAVRPQLEGNEYIYSALSTSPIGRPLEVEPGVWVTPEPGEPDSGRPWGLEQSTGWSTDNVQITKSLDADYTTLHGLADTVASMIEALLDIGIFDE